MDGNFVDGKIGALGHIIMGKNKKQAGEHDQYNDEDKFKRQIKGFHEVKTR